MIPSSITFDLGGNTYGQNVTARRYKNYMGKIIWDITQHAANQRDDTVTLSGLTDEQISKFAEMAKAVS